MDKRCADTRPPRQSPYIEHHPTTAKERWDMLDQYGPEAFLLPEGTPRKDLPAYPIVSKKSGCFHCGMMRMQLTRIGAALNRKIPNDYREKLFQARERLVDTALDYADCRDPGNSCNWALGTSKRMREVRKWLKEKEKWPGDEAPAERWRKGNAGPHARA